MNDIKFIVTGDLHWTGKNPKARLDNYKEALSLKLKEIFELALHHKCKGVIIPGDIFDSPGASLSVISELGNLLYQASKMDVKTNPSVIPDPLCPMDIFTIAGNHDVYSGNKNTLNRTPYGLLKQFRILTHIEEFVFPGFGLVLQGHSYNAEITDKALSYYLPHDSDFYIDEPRIKMLVTHGMLLDKAPGYELRHTLMSDVAEHPNAPDILINGHEHNGFGIKKINNTLFINPGSIGRIKATEENINRIPQVALLTIPTEGKGDPFAELIPLKSAKPGHEVLSREHIIEEKKRKEMTQKFLELLAEEGESKYQDLEQVVKGIGKRKHLPKPIVNEALKRLAEAREEGDHEQRSR
ncbi:MAG: metallophosphoesterase [Halanaerobiales bacterium]|nr:metallophosphoesterase [Halanaerobiales bacterium]